MVSAKGNGERHPRGDDNRDSPKWPTNTPGITFATFGGNPVSMAAASSVIQVIEEQSLLENCRVTGAYLSERFGALKEKHAIIGDARGLGMMQALELVRDRRTKEPNGAAVLTVFEECKKRGVLIGRGGVWGNVIRTGLMLNAGKTQVDELVEAIDAGLTLADTGGPNVVSSKSA